MSFTPADISVVIPSFNSRQTIGRTLQSLLDQEAPPREIILVDSSADGTVEYVAEAFPKVRIKAFKSRTFPGPARNWGSCMAEGAIIAFIDADCVAEPDWTLRLAEAHATGHLVAGGSVEVGNPQNAIAWAGHLGEFREFLPVGHPKFVDHIPTCNLSYRKTIFETMGGFPDAYYPQEDLLFNYMLRKKGLRIYFDPAIRIRHFYRENLREYLSHQHRIGRVTRSTLRRIEQPGSAIARREWLAWLASPFLGVVKFLRTSYVFLRHFPRELVRHPSLVFMLASGAIWWARGFAASARKGLSGIRGWDDPDEPIFAQIAESKR